MRFSLSRAAGALGAASLLVGALLSWFRVPTAAGPDLALPVVAREAPAGYAFRALCLVAAVLLPALAWTHRRHSSFERLRLPVACGSAGLLGLLLFFPHAVMVWCPATAATAQWLHVQHNSLTWFGGDLFGLHEVSGYNWKSRVLAADLLEQTTGMRLPSWSPDAIPFQSVQDLFDWFGLSNTFCQFVGIGWGASLTGCLMLVIATCRGEGGPRFPALRAATATWGAVLAVGTAFGLLPAVFAAVEMDRARSATEHGLSETALERIGTAIRFLPILGEDAGLAVQRGLLDARLGRNTPEASLYRAKVLQGQGMFDEAESILGPLAAAGRGPVRREALRGLTRRGIRELNSGEIASAAQSLEAVVTADPCDVKANYVLQLAYLRASRFDELRALAKRLRETYRFFDDQTKVPVLAATQENVAYAAYLQNDPGGAFAAWKTLGDPKKLTER